MSLPRYSEYKDSGVVWLGEVPGHWKMRSLRYAATIQNGSDFKDCEVVDGGFPVLGSGGEFARISKFIYDQPSVLLGRKGTIDNPLYIEEPFWTVDTLFYTKIAADTHPKFFYWFCTSIPFDYFQFGSAVPSMTQNDLYGIKVPTPSIEEQQTIAAFLDRETGKIDALIAEQRRLVELLAEKRQAVISHAVTKGLNPSAKMKDSGIEWLGEVPEHWDAVPMKYLVRFQSGGTPSKEQLDYWDGSLPWASAKDMKVEFLSDTEDHITELAIEHGAATLLDISAVLVVVRGMILARTFPVTLTRARMAINQDLKAVLPRCLLDSNFLAWYLRGTANESLSRLDEAGHGTKALRMDRWASLEIALPSIEEQVAIAAFLNSVTAQLDTLTAEANRAINLLQERRSALISAAVTGKIDLRQAA